MSWSRGDHLARLEREEFDVIVVGAGIVGAGIALDAVTRGLRTAVVDLADYASGTSGRSSKLFHGGIRYLPQMRFGLVHEGLTEQRVLRQTADYLYRPLEFVLPVYEGRGFGDMPTWLNHSSVIPSALGFGLWFYDRLGRRPRGSNRRLTSREVVELAPKLRPTDLKTGFLYHDAQTDDARLTLAVTQTAVDHGAVAVNWAAAESVMPRPEGYDVVIDAGEDRLRVRTRSVVAATGAFAPPPLDDHPAPLGVIKSKGIHLTIACDDLGIGDHAIVLPETEDGRVIFIVPWAGTAIVGTTDTPYEDGVAHPTATDRDIEYLTRHLHQYFDVAAVDPISTWAGLRALAATPGRKTSKASRKHKVAQPAPGYFQVAGGKLTGYRAIAEEITDDVAAQVGAGPGRTKSVALRGSGEQERTVIDAAAAQGFDATYGHVLYERYGGAAHGVLATLAEQPEWSTMLGDGHLAAGEAAYAARHESASRLTDITLRRTRLSLVTRDHGRESVSQLADVLGHELGWSAAQREVELEAFEDELKAEGL